MFPYVFVFELTASICNLNNLFTKDSCVVRIDSNIVSWKTENHSTSIHVALLQNTILPYTCIYILTKNFTDVGTADISAVHAAGQLTEVH